MKPSDQEIHDLQENDPVWDLLARDRETSPVVPSPWFATRTAALAMAIPRARSLWRRLLIPIPLAGLAGAAALIMLFLHSAALNQGDKESSAAFVSTEEGFEQNMEMLYASQD